MADTPSVSDTVTPAAEPVALRRSWVGPAALGGLLLLAPLVGLKLANMNLGPYFAFPPRPFLYHWPSALSQLLDGQLRDDIRILLLLKFVPSLLVVLAGAVILLWKLLRYCRVPALPRRTFPRWGWLALAWTGLWWWLAWAQPLRGWELQRHTFTPLWLGYIAFVNAWTWRRGGRALLIQSPRVLGVLALWSVLFWWFFEYLNRFVQNWYYTADRAFAPWEYALYSSIAFSTVLPAVVATHDLLATCGWLRVGLARMIRLRPWMDRVLSLLLLGGVCLLLMRDNHGAGGDLVVAAVALLLALTILIWGERVIGLLVFVLATVGLGAVGVAHNVLYPLLWVAPLLIVVSWRAFRGEPHFFTCLRRGDWRPLYAWALAALICGFFWEMWNAGSLVQWKYQIPLVASHHLFEMPALGYLGYIPFGWECAVMIGLVQQLPAPEPAGDATASP